MTEEEKEEQAKAITKQQSPTKENLIKSENGKAYSVDSIREKHKDAYRPWTDDLDKELTVMFCEGVNIRDMMKHFGRTRGAITSRIRKLELEELYG